MINIDLRNLTEDKRNIARENIRLNVGKDENGYPNTGACFYSTPCVIGTLFTRDEIETLIDESRDGVGIGKLVSDRHVAFPDDRQVGIASSLQIAFDCGNLDQLEKMFAVVDEYLAESA